MVKFSLQIQATLEAVEKLSTSHPDFQWFLKLKCENCGESSGKFHDLMESETFPLKHNRSETHLLLKCKLCSRENTVDIIEGSNASYTAADSGKYKGIIVFECRGVEPFEFDPRSGWIVESEDNGRKFQDVDLSEKEWVEYDDINNTSVGIYEFQSKFVKVK